MIRALALLAPVVLAAPAMAETIRVRSGEHAGFTRLVLAPAEATDWRLGRAGSGYEVHLAREGIAFDLSGAFDLIPRDRVADLSPGAGTSALAIGLGCECHATAFETAGGLIVIDVADGPPPAGSPFEAPFELLAGPAGEVEAPRDSGPSGDTAAEPAVAPFALPRVAALPATPDDELALLWRLGAERRRADATRPPARQAAAPPEANGNGAPPASLPAAEPRDGLAADTVAGEAGKPADPGAVAARDRLAEDELLLQISRGAAQGLLTVRPDAADGGGDVSPPNTDTGAQGEAGARVPEPASEPPGHSISSRATPEAASEPSQGPAPDPLSVRAETSIDRDLLDSPAAEEVTPNGTDCLDDALFDIPAWGSDRPGADQIATARAGLVGEFDRPDTEAILAMARLYLFLGFGAEARATLDGFAVPEADAPLLRTMARLVDGEMVPDAGILAGQAACEGRVALWAMLGPDAANPAVTVNHGAVVRSFSALPVHLRRALGPALARTFLDRGEADVARAVRDAVARAGGPPEAGLALVDAGIRLSLGDAAAAETALAAMPAGNDLFAPEAVLAGVTARLAAGRPVDARLADSAAAFAFEHRNGPLGPALARAAALALASSGDVEGAFSAIRDWPDADPEGAARVTAELAGIVAAIPGDEAFLPAYFAHRETMLAAEPGIETRLALARRLVEAGLADEAGKALAGEAATTEAGRELLAAAAMAAGRPADAVTLAEGLSSESAARLRAEALSASGNHRAAALSFAALGDTARAEREDWRAGARGDDLGAALALLGRAEADAADPGVDGAESGAAAAAADISGGASGPGEPEAQAAGDGSADPAAAGEAEAAEPRPAEGAGGSADTLAEATEAAENPGEDTGPIGTGRQLLRQSEEARAAIAALLDASAP